MKNFLLLFIAILAAIPLFPFGLIYAIIKYIRFGSVRRAGKGLSKMALIAAISIDQLGNVILAEPLNDLCVTKDGHRYGDEDETISQVTGENYLNKTLTPFGYRFNAFLDMAFGYEHSTHAVYSQRRKLEAYFKKYYDKDFS